MKSFLGQFTFAGSFFVVLLCPSFGSSNDAKVPNEVDICIYGGTSAGVLAAYTAAKYGKSVLLIEPGKNLGGMTSGGLGKTDIGNKSVVTGNALEFYRRIGKHYGRFEQWVFEPKIAEKIFREFITEEDVPVKFGKRVRGVVKNGEVISEIELEDSYSTTAPLVSVKAKVFIDCSYEGDLMARAGVSYHVGREGNEKYDETLNGVQIAHHHQFPDGIDPYREKGNPASGLLWGIRDGALETTGTADRKVQAYNYRLCLTRIPENRIEITKPDNYDPSKYELLIRWKEKEPWTNLEDAFIWTELINGKTDINNRNAFSTDMIGENWDYPDADYARREEIRKAHEDYTRGLLYFIGNDPRIPQNIRDEIKQWGYPKDEFTDNNHWPHQLYVREARRMIGRTVITQHHCQNLDVVTDGIAFGAYQMDSHNTDRIVVNGMVKNEGDVQIGGFDPYPISYRAITPKKNEAANLIVPVCASASHIAYGSLRMEPIFMVLGQSSAVAAVQAVEKNVPVQEINVPELQKELKSNPFVDKSRVEVLVDNHESEFVQFDSAWKTYRRGYGLNFLMTGATSETQAVKYVPEIPVAGTYRVYTYVPKVAKPTTKTRYKVFDGKKEHLVDLATGAMEIFVRGNGEWMELGDYQLPKGRAAAVELTNSGADGNVVADAMLWIKVD